MIPKTPGINSGSRDRDQIGYLGEDDQGFVGNSDKESGRRAGGLSPASVLKSGALREPHPQAGVRRRRYILRVD